MRIEGGQRSARRGAQCLHAGEPAGRIVTFSTNREPQQGERTILLFDGPATTDGPREQKENSVKRGFVVSVGGAAIVVAALAGCSSDSGSSESTTSADAGDTATASASAEATSAPGAAKVVIDGQEQNIQGTVACTSMGGNLNIAIGQATTGIGAVVTEADPPAVQSVGLGNVNGVTLGFQQGTGQGNAEVEKDDTTYTIKGNATGVDMANPLQPVTKPFEIEVTCP